ncbi:Myb-like DNA-binding domain protein [Theileria parva strain Muguga]|uniref:Myb-like DNA-binding domain protein n=1 Tax=Theileria parva strain Muguga TaxID=333668 RepID=UPI001C622EFA|nr:Myb-like DNA-binding domain protein [Theileria parva strain Muguga]KAF5153634.1 Myb-like DNA-binding domain protein [Theileria parva strain Muguga]
MDSTSQHYNTTQKDTTARKDTTGQRDLGSQRELRSSRRDSTRSQKELLGETSRVSSRSVSYSAVTNASLQLLKADFISYALLVQGKYFKNISQKSYNSSKSCKSEPTTARTDFNTQSNTQNLTNPLNKSDSKSAKFDPKYDKFDSKSAKSDPKSSQLSPEDTKLTTKNSKLSYKIQRSSPRELKVPNSGSKSPQNDPKSDTKTPKLSANSLKNLPFNPKLCYFNGLNCQKHSYLSFFSGLDLFVNSERFDEIFSQFENYVIKLFSVHPTVGSTRRGGYIDDDKAITSMLNYIRSYESSLHLLSQKQGQYFYISLFLLVVLLRNLRRLLHHYRANSTLLELLLILVEGVYLCQNHLYKFFTRSQSHVFQEKMKFYDPNEKNYKQLNTKELLKTLNENCNQCRNSIYNTCKTETTQFYTSQPKLTIGKFDDTTDIENQDVLMETRDMSINMDTQDVLIETQDMYGSNPVCTDTVGTQEKVEHTSRQQDPLEQSHQLAEDMSELPTARGEITSFYGKITSFYGKICSVPTGSQADRSLEYDLVEISEFSDLNFLLDDKVSEWISELCTLASFYCKLGNEPILLSSQFLKHTTHCATVLPKLSKYSFTNLSFGRILHLKLLNSLYYLRLSSNLKETPYRPNQALSKTTPTTQEENRKKRYTRWSDDEVDILVTAINRHGIGNWSFITRAYFLGTKSPMQLKDKWANLTRYSHVKQVEPPKTKPPEIKTWTLVHTHN